MRAHRPEAEITSDLDHWPTDPAQLAVIGAQHLAPVVLAVRGGPCRLATIWQRSRRFRFVGSAPIIGIVADDTTCALGPSGFHRKSVEGFVATCQAVAIVSSGAEVLPYAAVAGVSMLTGRNVAIVETRIEHETAWAELVRHVRPNAQMILCRPRPH